MPTSLTYQMLKDKNLCPHCRVRPPYKHYVCCEKCRELARQAQIRRRIRLKQQGLCIRCGKRKAIKGFTQCSQCRDNRSPHSKYRQPCIICGFEYSDVHHKDRNKQNNNPTNLVSLCPNHHRLVHWKLLSL